MKELTHFFALLLWFAAVLAFVGGMPQLGIAVIAVVLLNAVFSFVQESRADRAAERLQSLLPDQVTVLRDGRRRSVPAADVVVDDLLLLEAGDRIPADGDRPHCAALRLDTSMLTGESRAGRGSERRDGVRGDLRGRGRGRRAGHRDGRGHDGWPRSRA